MDNKTLKISELYRLPWSKNDNPNGWLEITTFCNMKCPGCYRGCNRSDNKQEHFPLERLKKEILMLKKIRNCHSISISGGEPLIHPQILEIVRFIKKEGMNPVIFTNGSLITKDLLIKLKSSGLTGIAIRVDSLRENAPDEIGLNNLRQKYADLVYSVGGLILLFVCVINKKNIFQIPKIVEWFQKNNKKTEILTLIAMRQVLFNKKERINMADWVYIPEICSEIWKKFPDLKYGAYLGSQEEDLTIKWLYSFWISLNNKVLGYLDKKFIEMAIISYHLKNGRYYYFLDKKNNFISFPKAIFASLLNKSMRKILKNYLVECLKNPLNLFKKMHLQGMNLVQPPGLVNGKRDLCDSCPDATLYNGKLYPSCGLEEVKKYRKLYEIT